MSEAQDLDYSQAASLTSSIFPSSNHRNRSESYGSTENCTMSSPLRQNPHIHPTIVSLPEKKSERKSKYECPAFQNEEDYDAYVDSISPSRELVCPITQEVLQDPVVAEDGHTYERSALMTWFSMGRTRSPVTNSIMAKKKVFPNLAVQGMAQAHREKLGLELLERSKFIMKNNGECPDNGSRIAALLDAGASTTLRDDSHGNTALLMLIQAPNLSLVDTLLKHDSSSVMLTNNAGMSCIQAIEDNMNYSYRKDTSRNHVSIHGWRALLEDVRKKQALEKSKIDARDSARSRANEEHRERQRTLAADARANNTIGPNTNDNNNNSNNLRGLGQLEDGWGYFPSLVALQFQSSIPPPPASFADIEYKQKQRLQFILRFFGSMLVLFLFWY